MYPGIVDPLVLGAARLERSLTMRATATRSVKRHSHRPHVRLPSSDLGAVTLARALAINGRVLHAVRDPHVGDAGRSEGLANRGADAPANDAMVDPELANLRVAMGQRESVACEWV